MTKTLLERVNELKVTANNPEEQVYFDALLWGKGGTSKTKYLAVSAYFAAKAWEEKVGLEKILLAISLIGVLKAVDSTFSCPMKAERIFDELASKIIPAFEDAFTPVEREELKVLMNEELKELRKAQETKKHNVHDLSDEHGPLLGYVKADNHRTQYLVNHLVDRIHIHSEDQLRGEVEAAREMLSDPSKLDFLKDNYVQLFRNDGIQITRTEAEDTIRAFVDGNSNV